MIQPETETTTLEIRPISKTEARAFVQAHHRHNEAPSSMQVSLVAALYEDDELIGVATAGHPVARLLHDGFTIEINRTCVDGYHRNANSMLYAAICWAAKALGYRQAITYTLQDESGASLRGAGFEIAEDVRVRSWDTGSKVRTRYDYNLFGERMMTQGQPKYRWERQL